MDGAQAVPPTSATCTGNAALQYGACSHVSMPASHNEDTYSVQSLAHRCFFFSRVLCLIDCISCQPLTIHVKKQQRWGWSWRDWMDGRALHSFEWTVIYKLLMVHVLSGFQRERELRQILYYASLVILAEEHMYHWHQQLLNAALRYGAWSQIARQAKKKRWTTKY